jgi:triosephosphate isomerase
VWAINKRADLAPPAAQVREMAIFIRKTLADVLGRRQALKVPVLYGGSVEASNAAALIGEGDIAGLLVGHASAELESFVEILNACKK